MQLAEGYSSCVPALSLTEGLPILLLGVGRATLPCCRSPSCQVQENLGPGIGEQAAAQLTTVSHMQVRMLTVPPAGTQCRSHSSCRV